MQGVVKRATARRFGVVIFALTVAFIVTGFGTELVAQDAGAGPDRPWWGDILYFVVALPLTLVMMLAEGDRLAILPGPILGALILGFSFREWKRQRFWTPRLVHVMSGLALLTIIAINVDWVLAGGSMWTQRYVVIALFGIAPYVVYLLFLGPRSIGRKRAPAVTGGSADRLTTAVERPEWRPLPTDPIVSRGSGRPAAPRRSGAALRGAFAAGLVFVAIAIYGPTVSEALERPSRAMPEWADVLANPEQAVPNARGLQLGSDDAAITIVEFGDYQCPACAAFATRFRPDVERDFVESGRARFVFYDLPLTSIHDNAVEAARAARCAGDQDAFWVYHDELFRTQEQWSPLASPSGFFIATAETLDLDAGALQECLRSDRHTQVVDANRALARRLEINSTPTIIIVAEGAEPRRVSNYRYETIVEAVEEALASTR